MTPQATRIEINDNTKSPNLKQIADVLKSKFHELLFFLWLSPFMFNYISERNEKSYYILVPIYNWKGFKNVLKKKKKFYFKGGSLRFFFFCLQKMKVPYV